MSTSENPEEIPDQPAGQEVEASGPASPDATPNRMTWMEDTLEWGVRAQPGKHGLTMRDINTGIYGDVPDESQDMSRRPRGAFPIPGVPRTDLYTLNHKVELWADNAVDLYEEAIQRRWMAHIDIPWESMEPHSEEVELATRQLCTELAQQASIETDVIGQWLHHMNYAYHEVKTFLASELFDSGRHYAAFRQRALANGGGLGLESPGHMNRRILECRAGWTETALYLYILRGTLTLLLYRYGEAYAQDPAEKLLFRMCMQDKSRHMAYGMAHLKYAVDEKGPDYALGLRRLMGGVERDLASEMKDPVLWEALAIIIGRGVEHMDAGMAEVKNLQRRYIEEYLTRMKWIGVGKTADNLDQGLAAYLDQKESSPA
ncbi:MAG: hypothetical protein VX638_07525 [Chloroflexota bacterium]|nr:hypothetical protein [Chloroflexota bacterium]